VQRFSGGRLKKLRKSAGLSRHQLAAEAGCSYSAIAAYELGNSVPLIRHLTAVADVLGEPVGELFDGCPKSRARADR
jgi:transcriptional regulator with XRE-family HTH domain